MPSQIDVYFLNIVSCLFLRGFILKVILCFQEIHMKSFLSVFHECGVEVENY